MKSWITLVRHSARHHWRHKGRALLNIFGVALGVAVVVAIQVVNHSALQSFRASIDVIAGRANFVVEGEGARFSESIFVRVLQAPHVVEATPVVQELAVLPDYPGEFLRIVGIDPFTNHFLSTYTIEADDEAFGDPVTFVAEPNAVTLTRPLAQRLGLRKGDRLRVRFGGAEGELVVRFFIRFAEGGPSGDERLALMDISSVQHVFGLGGMLDRIDVLLEPPSGMSLEQAARETAESLAPWLEPHVRVGAPGQRGTELEKMIGAFQLNLTALSLVSLLVGMFLIYNTVSGSVVRRRSEIGLLRALGMGRGQVQVMLVGEAVLTGVVGCFLGVLVGWWLAGQMVGLVAQTITSLYILLSIQHLFFDPWIFAGAVLVGLLSVVVAAWLPALEASRVEPVEALNLGHLAERSRERRGRWLWASWVAAVAALGLSLGARMGYVAPWVSFVAALATLLTFAFWVPLVSVCLARWGQRWLGRWILVRLALDHFERSLHRNAVGTAALVTALAMMGGITVMVASFRQTVDHWIRASIQADVFVAPASQLSLGVGEFLPQEMVEAMKRLPGVRGVDLYREQRLLVNGRPAKVAATQLQVLGDLNPLVFLHKAMNNPLKELDPERHALISETMMRASGLQVGDEVELTTPTGVHRAEIVGVFRDYTSEQGVVLLDRSTFVRWWGDQRVNSMAFFLMPGADLSAWVEKLREMAAPFGEYLVYSNFQLRMEALRVFDQTFAVTTLLQWVALIVAGLGIFLTVGILTAERTRETGILRACGATRGQWMVLVLVETACIGVVGAILGLLAGLALAVVLTHVINVVFFGWTIDWAMPWAIFWQLPLGSLLVALGAALIPAWCAARMEIATAVREE